MLYDHIKIGKVYQVYPQPLRGGFRCGQCGKHYPDIELVWVKQHGREYPGLMPWGLFHEPGEGSKS
jgi:hypothetical protein